VRKMKFLSVLSLALCAGQTVAHADSDSDVPVPRLAGARKFLREFKGERRWEQSVRSASTTQPRDGQYTDGLDKRGEIKERQNTSGKCGSRYGSCAKGYCCSIDG
jgi:hypothetical protein